jgi:hypothetical protein
MKAYIRAVAAVAFVLTMSSEFAMARGKNISSGSETVVNLLDAGLASAQYKALSPADPVMSCQYDIAHNGTFPLADIARFVPELGKKYVLPIKEDSTCIGKGLQAVVGSPTAIAGDYVEVYLEDMTSGARINIGSAGCVVTGNFAEFISSLNPPNVQLVIRAKRASSNAFWAFLGFTNNQAEVDLYCSLYKRAH